MKTKILLIICTLSWGIIALTSCNQKKQYRPDAKIITAFNTQYPQASKIEWEHKQGYQVAEFRNNGNETEAWFDNNGKLLMTKNNLKYTNLPQAIQDHFEKSIYSNWKKQDIDKIVRSGMSAVYIIEVEKEGQDTDLYYNENGNLVKTSNDISPKNPHHYQPVSPVISDIITQKYPEATIIEIDTDKTKPEIDILDGGKNKEVIFNGDSWVSTSWEVKKSEVPNAVMEAFRKSVYRKYRIDNIHFYETPTTSYYLFALEQGNSETRLTIDLSGKIIQ